MFQLNHRRMLTLASVAAAISPFVRPKSAAATDPERTTGPTVVLDPPVRIYDSRNPLGGGPPKKITSGQERAFGLIPIGPPEGPYGPALAGAFINLTVSQTVGAGFLTVHSAVPGRPVTTSNINWTSDGQTIANSSLVPVAGENVINLICIGGETHFIIDLQGYVPYLPVPQP